MTMNGGIMESQRQAAAWLSGAPISTFASLPAASTVEGQVRRLTELPHVSLIALGGIWRPFGGRQVLAMRTTDPVTIQSLTDQAADRTQVFPGGLVRAGMRLEMRCRVRHPAVGTAERFIFMYLGAGAAPTTDFYYARAATNNPGPYGPYATLIAQADIYADSGVNAIARIDSVTYGVGAAGNFLGFDPSLDWSAGIGLRSCAETAVNIATATWAGGVATYNTSAASTLAVGDKTTIAGVDLAGYNGVVIVASVVDTDTFTVAMASDPGGSGTGGTSSRISNMRSQSYVLELVG